MHRKQHSRSVNHVKIFLNNTIAVIHRQSRLIMNIMDKDFSEAVNEVSSDCNRFFFV